MAKQPATIFVCQHCGHQSRKWIGQCPDCNEWNTMVEERFRATAQAAAAGGSTFRLTQAAPVAFSDIESQDDSRSPSGIDELDRVLGRDRRRLARSDRRSAGHRNRLVIQMADHSTKRARPVCWGDDPNARSRCAPNGSDSARIIFFFFPKPIFKA